MRRTVKDFILDMRNAIQEAEEFTTGMTLEEFTKDRRTINAVIRSLEVLGEAAKRIPAEMTSRYREAPWKELVGMRDRLIHGYHGVNLAIIWHTIHQDLPPLKPLVEKMLQEVEEEA